MRPEVVPRERLEASVDERIDGLAALDATALRDTKTLFARPGRTPVRQSAAAAAASLDRGRFRSKIASRRK